MNASSVLAEGPPLDLRPQKVALLGWESGAIGVLEVDGVVHRFPQQLALREPEHSCRCCIHIGQTALAVLHINPFRHVVHDGFLKLSRVAGLCDVDCDHAYSEQLLLEVNWVIAGEKDQALPRCFRQAETDILV